MTMRTFSLAASALVLIALSGCASNPITSYQTSTNGVSFKSSYKGLGTHTVSLGGAEQPLLRATMTITTTWLVPASNCYATWEYTGAQTGGSTLHEYTSMEQGDRVISVNTAYIKKAAFYVIPLIPDSMRHGLDYGQYFLAQRALGRQFNWSLPNTPGIGTFLVSGSTGKILKPFYVYGYNGEPILALTKSTCVFSPHSKQQIRNFAIYYNGQDTGNGKLLFRIDGIYGPQMLAIPPNDRRWHSVAFGRYRGVGFRVMAETSTQIEVKLRDLDSFGYPSASSDMMSVVETETRLPLQPN